MTRKDWAIAAAVVLGLLALLAVEPGSDPAPTDPGAPPDAGIVELPAVDSPTIATVELEPAERPAAATELATRFDREDFDPEWAAVARRALDESLVRVYDDYGAALSEVVCRTTTCRVRLEVDDASRRPAAVAAALAALQRDGHETLLERADDTHATLVIGVRTPRTP